MKRLLLPAVIVIALAGSAFTKFSTFSSRFGTTMYYDDGYDDCGYTYIIDANCVTTQLNYICYEDVEEVGWTVMLKHEVGNSCYGPYYSYYPNNP